MAPGLPGGLGRIPAAHDALVSYVRSLGDQAETGRGKPLAELDLTPRQMAAVAGDRLDPGPVAGSAVFRLGPGSFKMGYAPRRPPPWKNEACGRAASVHVGGTLRRWPRPNVRIDLPAASAAV